MNERIKELAEQASIQEGSHGAFGEPTINEYVDLEKFAELIVQECCDILDTFDCQFEIESIKDHFEDNK
jgi:hypothetical protein